MELLCRRVGVVDRGRLVLQDTLESVRAPTGRVILRTPDPEWAVGPDETPGDVFGTTTGGELNAVADHVAAIAREHSLPQKPLIYHQLSPSVVRDEQDLAPHPELALVKSMDGIGSPELKKQAWDKLVTTKPPHVATGIKLFFQEDTRSGPLMTPPEVLGLQPAPDYVLYE